MVKPAWGLPASNGRQQSPKTRNNNIQTNKTTPCQGEGVRAVSPLPQTARHRNGCVEWMIDEGREANHHTAASTVWVGPPGSSTFRSPTATTLRGAPPDKSACRRAENRCSRWTVPPERFLQIDHCLQSARLEEGVDFPSLEKPGCPERTPDFIHQFSFPAWSSVGFQNLTLKVALSR